MGIVRAKSNTDILFVCPAGGDFYDADFKYTLGSAYIIAYLRKNGFNAKQFLANTSFSVNDCIKAIISKKPKVVGFTVYNSNFMQSVLICRRLKLFTPKILTIFGGPTPTVQSEEILKFDSSIDICVRGEGEEVTLNIMKKLKDNNFNFENMNLMEIKGVSYRKKDQIYRNPDANVLFSHRSEKNYIDKYPSPYLSKVVSVAQAFPLGVITARGCNQNCVYCNCAIMSKRNLYFHSISRVIEELSYISENRSSNVPIPINDDGFTIVPSRARKICERIIESSIDIPLACITRADKVNEELLDLMKQAGFRSIGFSLESAVPKVLRNIGKTNPPCKKGDYEKENEFLQDLEEMTRYARKIGLHPVFISIMLGLPGETLQDAEVTISMVKKLDIDYYVHNKFHIYKGTPIYENHNDFNYKIYHYGQKNKIFTYNSHPYNINEISYGDNSAELQNFKFIDYKSLKILSNNPSTNQESTCFENLILKSNHITKKLILWMQDNLALNGAIIQLYTSKNRFTMNDKKNKGILYDEISPTKYHKSYFWEKNKLLSEEMADNSDQIGFPIEFLDINSALRRYSSENDSVENIISMESTSKDSLKFLKFMEKISNINNPYDYLINSNIPPQYLNLCRWSSGQANCKTLDTVIVENNKIKICWYGNSIGEIGISYQQVKKKIEELTKKVKKRRDCKNCAQNLICNNCIYPEPLSSKNYCQLKNRYPLTNTANLFNSISVLKDLIFEPITLLDY